MIKKIYILISMLFLILTLCSCGNKPSEIVNQEYINDIFKNSNITHLEKIDYNSNEKLLIFHINDEVISEDEFKTSLSNYQFKKNYGLEAFKDDKILNIANKIKFSYKNNNNFILDNKDSKIVSNIVSYTYSSEYINQKLKNIAENIIKFNDIIGKIEVDLDKNLISENVIEILNKNYNILLQSINDFENIKNKDMYLNNTDIDTIKKYSEILKDKSEKAISLKNSKLISQEFLKINELDKIARNLNKEK